MMEYVGNAAARPGPYILHYGVDWSVTISAMAGAPSLIISHLINCI